MRAIALLILSGLLIIQSTEAGIRSRGFNYKDRSQRSGFASGDAGEKQKNQQIPSENVKRGSPLSAWGIIGIILAAIIISTTGYYAFVFYPYLCKKERNYDMIELTNVV